MLNNSLISLYHRDLDKLGHEINQYQNEASIWALADGISNSGGNLALHLLGNLNTYIGKNLGGTDYVRDRPAEFASKNIPKAEILARVELIKTIIENTLNKLSTSDFESTYPEEVLGYHMTTEYFLLHLLAHLNYHLGQINYHRRLVIT